MFLSKRKLNLTDLPSMSSLPLWLLILAVFYHGASASCRGGAGSQYFDCKKPFECNKTWKDLMITNYTFDRLKPNSFKKCSSLSNLLIFKSKQTELQSSMFNGLNRLEKLIIQNMSLRSLGFNFLSSMPKLNYLKISREGTLQILKNNFISCSNLETLVFEDTYLVNVGSNAFSSCEDTLKSLRLRSANLVEIQPTSFNSLTSLTSLDLSMNKLKELGPRLFQELSGLNILTLRQNTISKIDENAFAGLILLKNLDLSDNRITVFSHAMLSRVPHLTTLSLDKNRLIRIDSSILSSPGKLQSISLKNNPFLCKPLQKGETPAIYGLSVSLPFCPKTTTTTTTTAKPEMKKVLNPQRLKDKREDEESTKNKGHLFVPSREMIIMTPPWLLAWATCMTVGLVIAVCVLAFIVWGRRRRRLERNGNYQVTEQNQPSDEIVTL